MADFHLDVSGSWLLCDAAALSGLTGQSLILGTRAFSINFGVIHVMSMLLNMKYSSTLKLQQ